jgi:hypothetical protein
VLCCFWRSSRPGASCCNICSQAGASAKGVTSHTIHALGVLYDAMAAPHPRQLVVPLLECAGWGAGALRSSPAAASTFAQNGELAQTVEGLNRDLRAVPGRGPSFPKRLISP